jgi:hypothetical protein
MKTYEIFITHKLNYWEKYDFFIFSPHAWHDRVWLDFIKNSLVKNEFDDEILYSYIKHEADIWTKEIASKIFENIKKNHKDIKICVILWLIPRAFCDLNRNFERACPEIVKSEIWQWLNDETMDEIENIINLSKYWLHLHTMNSKNNVINWNFCPHKTNKDLVHFLNNWYTWSIRNDNILTDDNDWNYHSFKELDDIFIKNWQKNNINLDKNIAYKFEKYFTATRLISKVPSSLIEITKGNIATLETKDSTNWSKIILDEKKIEKYSWIIVESIVEFFQKK